MSPTFLDDDLYFMDTVLMGLDSMDADLNRPDDITNLFDFNMWRSAPVEPFSIKNTNSLETVLYKMSTDIGLQNSKELSSLKTTDTDLGRMANLRTRRQARSGACQAEATSISWS